MRDGPVTIIAGGLKQGSNLAKNGRQPRKTWTPISQAAVFEKYIDLVPEDASKSLLEVKRSALAYQLAKDTVRGKPESPFREWLVSDKQLQMYKTM